MTNNNIEKPSGYFVARTYEIAGAAVSRFPRIERAVVGSKHPKYVPLHWMTYGQLADSVGRWIEFEAGTTKSRLPAKFNEIRTMFGDKQFIDSNVARGARQAVAYTIGETVMVGAVLLSNDQNPNFFETRGEVFTGQYYQTALRVGREAGRMGMGILNGDNEFVSLVVQQPESKMMPIVNYGDTFA